MDKAHPLIGVWMLVAWSEVREDGFITYPLGKDPNGLIAYTPDGHVAARFLWQQDELNGEAPREATDADARGYSTKEAFEFLGRYSIDFDSRTVIHHMETRLRPHLTCMKQVQRFRLKDRQLILDANSESGRILVVWERAPDSLQRQLSCGPARILEALRRGVTDIRPSRQSSFFK